MKGIILAGGKGTRLRPLTKITCKQLLPVYDRPMIYYPVQTLVSSGITDILVIVAPDYAGQFLHLLGSGKEFGAHFSYAIQEEPRGLPEAFIIGEDFMDNEPVTMILGDNIFDTSFSPEIANFTTGGLVFAKQVPDPQRFGVVEFDSHMRAVSFEEKPKDPKSQFAVVGLYIYDHHVVEYAKSLTPSARGELEITDIHKLYLKHNQLKVSTFTGLWEDAGTFDSLLAVSNYMAAKAKGEVR